MHHHNDNVESVRYILHTGTSVTYACKFFNQQCHLFREHGLHFAWKTHFFSNTLLQSASCAASLEIIFMRLSLKGRSQMPQRLTLQLNRRSRPFKTIFMSDPDPICPTVRSMLNIYIATVVTNQCFQEKIERS